MNCIICGKSISKKARTCSAKCKQIAYRNKKQAPTVTSVTLASVTEPTVTDLELCRYCDKPLPVLTEPRRWPGTCYDCAIKRPRKPSVEAPGELVYAGSEYVPPTD